MYTFPFLLLTADDVRNGNIADMFDEEISQHLASRKSFFETLPDELPVEHLQDILSIEVLLGNIFSDMCKCNMNILSSDLPEMDIWRVRERVKRLLTLLRRKSVDLIHPFDNFTFSDKVKKHDLWEDNDAIFSGQPENWNALVLTRISEIHQNVTRFANEMTPRLLVYNQVLKQSDSVDKEREAMDKIEKMVDTTRSIGREVKDYLRLIGSL
jgi:hypothetical protein